MQVGFAMLLAGSIRSKNVKNVLLWNLLDSAGGAVGFWSFGYAFAYGGDDSSKGWTFIGNRGFFLSDDIDLEFCKSLLRIYVPSLHTALTILVRIARKIENCKGSFNSPLRVLCRVSVRLIQKTSRVKIV